MERYALLMARNTDYTNGNFLSNHKYNLFPIIIATEFLHGVWQSDPRFENNQNSSAKEQRGENFSTRKWKLILEAQ